MELIGDILIFLGVVILIIIALVGFAAFKVYWHLKKAGGHIFTEFSRRQKKDGNSRGGTTYTRDGVTIYDQREPSQAQKKIFAQDEGEYVDFTENP